ncbi:MAG: DNA polymerase beta superfamily protein [Candidatus Hermodarchaeota archaeon]
MKDKIQRICQDLENEHNIRILFAVENGSRAWGLQSADSDYDVRFVFVRPLSEYIQIQKPNEVINIAFDRNFNIYKVEGSFIDISGFDIFKFVKLLSNSNPTTIEWLVSDIVYYGKQNNAFKRFAQENFSKISLYHHYKSLCRNNYLKYIKSGKNVTYKRYLYTFRGLVNARWVINKKIVPPITFIETIKGLDISDQITKKIQEMIKLKSHGKEKERIEPMSQLDQYIEAFLEEDPELPRESHPPIDELNNELRKIVLAQG